MHKFFVFLSIIFASNFVFADEYPAQFCHLFSGVTPLTEDDVASARAFFGDGVDVGGCRVENNRYARVFLYGTVFRELGPKGDYYLCDRNRLGVNAALRDQENGKGKKIHFRSFSHKSLLRYSYLVWILPKGPNFENGNLDCKQAKKADAILLYYPIEKNTLIRLYKNWMVLLKSTEEYQSLGIYNYADRLRIESIGNLPFSLGGLYILKLAGSVKGECKRYSLTLSTTESGAFDPVAVKKDDCG